MHHNYVIKLQYINVSNEHKWNNASKLSFQSNEVLINTKLYGITSGKDLTFNFKSLNKSSIKIGGIIPSSN